MKTLTTLFAAAVIVAGATAANAQGASQNSPGHQMQDKGSVNGSPGASGYAPGHLMQKNGSVRETTGASGYSPGYIKRNAAKKSKNK